MNWPSVDRWVMGEAWVGSRIAEHLQVFCDDIDVCWAGTASEQQAAENVILIFTQMGLLEEI